MRILIAPNAFKNSLSAESAANAIEAGLNTSGGEFTCTCFPVADGGDGTDELLTKNLNGQMLQTEVQDPLGRTVKARYGWIEKESTAIIGIAAASGMGLLRTEELDPLRGSSFGTGQLITDALDRSAKKILIAMGGSATVDGGTGILSALGVRFLDSHANELTTPESLVHLRSIDVANIDKRLRSVDITVLCDVDNPLLGSQGAAAVFGPQKGASPDAVAILEEALTNLAAVVLDTTGNDIRTIPYSGAAGGAAAALWAFLSASLVDGAAHFLALTDFEKSLNQADMVITGEGSLDAQTLRGKAPYRVAKMAKEKQIRVIGMAGRIPDEAKKELHLYFDELIMITAPGMDQATALASTAANLSNEACQLGARLAAL